MVYAGVPKRVIKKAWSLDNGVHKLGHSRMSRFPYRVTKDNKMLTVSNHFETAADLAMQGEVAITVFPRLEHVEAFRKASKGARAFGPGRWNPDAVGTLEIRTSEKGPYELEFAQSHFVTKRPGDSPRITKRLDRPLATKYHGWRQRALREAVTLLASHGKSLRVPSSVLVSEEGKPTKFAEDLKKVCGELGASVKKDISGNMVISKST
jgi:hypothetical protein